MRIPSFLACFSPKVCREGGAAKEVEPARKPCGTLTVEPVQYQDASTSCDFLVSSVQADAFTFSWAVVDSGGRVHCHHLGQETAAAQTLHQALDAVARAVNPCPDSAFALCAQECAMSEGKSASSSLLLTLLGPQLEPVALETAQMGRPWKGTIYAQQPATWHTYDCSAHDGCHFNPAKPAAAEGEHLRGKEAAAYRDTGDSGPISGRPARKSHGKGSTPWSLTDKPDKTYLSNPQLESCGISDQVPPNNMCPSTDVGHSLCPSVDVGLSPQPSLDLGSNAPEHDGRGSSLHQSSCTRGLQFSQPQTPGRGSRAGRISLQMSTRDIDRLMSGGSCESAPNARTKTFLKSLSQAEHFQFPPSGCPKCITRLPDLDEANHSTQGDNAALTQTATMESTVDSMDKFLDPARDAEEQPQQQLIPTIGDPIMHSFDVAVSLLDHTKGAWSPLLVVITDSTEHLKVRSTLTALAETQLELMSNIMPKHVMQFLAMESSEAVPEHVGQLARAHESVTLLFMDIVGFTVMSKEVKPVQVMAFLNTLFSHFDKLVDIHGVHKVETAGDCYIVSGGLMRQADGFGGMEVEESHDPAESALRVMEFAKAILDVAGQVEMPNTHQPVRIRIGMHTGDVVSGMIGTKLPKFSCFGVPGRIHVSKATRELLLNEDWEPTGGVEVKGKGLMDSYLWIPQPFQPSASQHFDASNFLPLPPGLSDARQPTLDLPMPRFDSSPGKDFFFDSHRSHAPKSYGVLNA